MSLAIGAIPDKGKLNARQSPTAHMPSIPIRGIVFGAGSSGKSTLLVGLLTNPLLYGNCFDAVYAFSHSVHHDGTWNHLKEYRASKGQKPDQYFFDAWDDD